MTFERHEYAEFAQKQRAQEAERRAGTDLFHTATLLQQAAVSAADLTSDPKWNVYLQYLQAGLEHMTRARDFWQAALLSPDLVNHEQIIKAKIGWATADATIKAWQVAIGLPKDIEAYGNEAKDVMSRLDPEGTA